MKKNVLLLVVAIFGMALTSAIAQNKAIQFQDSSFAYLDENIAALGEATNTVTFEAWVKPDTVGGFKNWAGIVYQRNDAGASSGLQTTAYRPDTIEFIPMWADVYWLETKVYLAINQWQHVAMTVSPSAVKAFLNGQLAYTYVPEEGDVPVQNFQGTEPMTIGLDRYHETWFGRTWRGGIDEVRIWNVTKTDEEIAASFSQQLNGNEAGLVAYYNFNNVIGSIIPNGGVGPTASIKRVVDSKIVDGFVYVGVNEGIQKLDNVLVFANQKDIKITNTYGTVSVEIYNPIGQVVLSKTISGDAIFTMDQNNVYIVKVTADNKVFAGKVLVCD